MSLVFSTPSATSKYAHIVQVALRDNKPRLLFDRAKQKRTEKQGHWITLNHDANERLKNWLLHPSTNPNHLNREHWLAKIEGWALNAIDDSEPDLSRTFEASVSSFNAMNSKYSILPEPESNPPRVLDICMAPGGFATAVRQANVSAIVHGYTIRPLLGTGMHHSVNFSQSVNQMLIPRELTIRNPSDSENFPGGPVHVHLANITMLRREFYPTKLPDDIIDYPSWEERLFTNAKYQLVLADGDVRPDTQVEDTSYLMKHLRLLAAEIVIGLTRLESQGVFVLRLNIHGGIAFELFLLITSLKQCSNFVTIYKPEHVDNSKSYCYLIAKGVQVQADNESCSVNMLINRWKRIWKCATLRELGRSDADEEATLACSSETVDRALAEHGPEMVELMKEAMLIQTTAQQSRNDEARKKVPSQTTYQPPAYVIGSVGITVPRLPGLGQSEPPASPTETLTSFQTAQTAPPSEDNWQSAYESQPGDEQSVIRHSQSEGDGDDDAEEETTLRLDVAAPGTT